MSGFLEMIDSLDREIKSIITEYGEIEADDPSAANNNIDSTAKNVIDSASKNVVDVTSKNFVSTIDSNILQSPFIKRQEMFVSKSLKEKGEGGESISASGLMSKIAKLFQS